MAESPGTGAEFTALLKQLADTAIKLLDQFGEFYPFGGVLNVIGGFELMNMYSDDAHPSAKDLAANLHRALQQGLQDQRFIAFGIAANVRTANPQTGVPLDAIRCHLVHSTGEAIDIIVPYKKDGTQYSLMRPFPAPAEGVQGK